MCIELISYISRSLEVQNYFIATLCLSTEYLFETWDRFRILCIRLELHIKVLRIKSLLYNWASTTRTNAQNLSLALSKNFFICTLFDDFCRCWTLFLMTTLSWDVTYVRVLSYAKYFVFHDVWLSVRIILSMMSWNSLNWKITGCAMSLISQNYRIL